MPRGASCGWSGVPRSVETRRRPHRCCRIGEAASDPARSETPRTRGNISHGNREIPRPSAARSGERCRRAHREAQGRTTMSHGRGKSDCGVVPKKLPNKAAGAIPAAAEAVEGRRRAKGNAVAARMSRRSSRVYDVGTALDGIRQTARGRRGAKFTRLLHHIYAVETAAGGLLRAQARCGRRGGRPDLAVVRAGPGEQPAGPVRPAGPRGLPAPACEAGVHRQGRRQQAPAGRARAGGQDRPARHGRSAQRHLRAGLPRASATASGPARARTTRWTPWRWG